MNRDTLFKAFFAVLFLALLYQCYVLLRPLLMPLGLGVVLWLLALPMDQRFSRWWPRLAPGWRAAVSTLAVLAVIVVPLGLLLTLFVNEFRDLIPRLQFWFNETKVWLHHPSWQHGAFYEKVEMLYARWPWLPRPDLQDKLTDLGGAFLGKLSNAGGALAASTATLAFYLFVILLTLFFFFKDGRHWSDTLSGLVPMRAEQKKRLMKTIRSTVTTIVRGAVLTSLCQTAIAIVGYWIVGVDAAVTLGFATGLASLIPVVGSALVWLPVAMYFLLHAVWWKCVFMVLWGAIAIGMSDNVIRTFFLGQSDEMPLYLLFLGLMGGVIVYGPAGLLIGPLIVAVLPVFVDMYREMALRND